MVNHPTAQQVQKEPLERSSKVGDAASAQRDVLHKKLVNHDFSFSEAVHQQSKERLQEGQAAVHSADYFSPELEQSFQRIFEDSCFMQ